jgi:hypothetical protein
MQQEIKHWGKFRRKTLSYLKGKNQKNLKQKFNQGIDV